ncbi:MAG: hypothetical protein D3907_14925 [Candidatus Electrothrix sp. AUS3]|nr:hypothetical protein [Candidatus Electrothrix gigas]
MKHWIDAGEWFIHAIHNVTSTSNDLYTTGVLLDYLVNLHSADLETRTILVQKWFQAGLDRIFTLDQLEQQLNEHN